jgi:uncharacterized phage protein gp47/JayE
MALFERSINDIVNEAILDVSAGTNLNKFSPGSKTRALLQTNARHLNYAYKVFDINLAKSFLSGATGQYIDYIGELLGVRRLGTETAKASAEAKILKFFVDTGNFGNINGGNPITLPQGTLISSEKNTSGVVYRMISGVVLGASSTEGWVNVEAVSPGADSNVSDNTLRYHSFSNYTDILNESLKVTNVAGIFTGSNTESDTNYKFRISRSVLAGEAGNDTSIILSSLSVPGVANVTLQKRAYGIGTYALYVKSVTPTVSANLLEAVEAAALEVSSEGIKGFIMKPIETGLSVEVSILYDKGISLSEKDAIDRQVINNVKDYVNNGEIGDSLSLSALQDKIVFSSPSIKSIGTSDKRLTVFVHKETKLKDNKIKQELLSDYAARANERVIIEPSVSVPVLITRLN